MSDFTEEGLHNHRLRWEEFWNSEPVVFNNGSATLIGQVVRIEEDEHGLKVDVNWYDTFPLNKNWIDPTYQRRTGRRT